MSSVQVEEKGGNISANKGSLVDRESILRGRIMTLMKVTSQVDSYRLNLWLLYKSRSSNSGGVLRCKRWIPGGSWQQDMRIYMYIFLKAYCLVSAHPPVSKFIICTFFSESLEITVFSNLLYLSISLCQLTTILLHLAKS